MTARQNPLARFYADKISLHMTVLKSPKFIGEKVTFSQKKNNAEALLAEIANPSLAHQPSFAEPFTAALIKNFNAAEDFEQQEFYAGCLVQIAASLQVSEKTAKKALDTVMTAGDQAPKRSHALVYYQLVANQLTKDVPSINIRLMAPDWTTALEKTLEEIDPADAAQNERYGKLIELFSSTGTAISLYAAQLAVEKTAPLKVEPNWMRSLHYIQA